MAIPSTLWHVHSPKIFAIQRGGALGHPVGPCDAEARWAIGRAVDDVMAGSATGWAVYDVETRSAMEVRSTISRDTY